MIIQKNNYSRICMIRIAYFQKKNQYKIQLQQNQSNKNPITIHFLDFKKLVNDPHFCHLLTHNPSSF